MGEFNLKLASSPVAVMTGSQNHIDRFFWLFANLGNLAVPTNSLDVLELALRRLCE